MSILLLYNASSIVVSATASTGWVFASLYQSDYKDSVSPIATVKIQDCFLLLCVSILESKSYFIYLFAMSHGRAKIIAKVLVKNLLFL